MHGKANTNSNTMERAAGTVHSSSFMMIGHRTAAQFLHKEITMKARGQ